MDIMLKILREVNKCVKRRLGDKRFVILITTSIMLLRSRRINHFLKSATFCSPFVDTRCSSRGSNQVVNSTDQPHEKQNLVKSHRLGFQETGKVLLT